MKSNLNTSKYKFLMGNFSRNILDSIISVQLPSFALGTTVVPLQGGMKINHPGTSADYGTLIVEMVIDERLENYEVIYDWMLRNYDPRNGTGEKDAEQGKLQICRDNGTVRREIFFRNLWPNDISEITLASNDADGDFEVAIITFLFDYFELVPLEKSDKKKREEI